MALRRDGAMLLLSTLQHHFSALFNCCFYCLLLLSFLPLKTLFGINDSCFAEFSSFSCKNNEFFLFYFMLFRERPRNQHKFNTHSYASLVFIPPLCCVCYFILFFVVGLKEEGFFSLSAFNLCFPIW